MRIKSNKNLRYNLKEKTINVNNDNYFLEMLLNNITHINSTISHPYSTLYSCDQTRMHALGNDSIEINLTIDVPHGYYNSFMSIATRFYGDNVLSKNL
jgi:hypothetical protein